MRTQVEIETLAQFVLETCDYHPDYEDDQFVVQLEGSRFYVERKPTMFLLHVGNEKHKLPRF